eukprot:gene19498-25389_t
MTEEANNAKSISKIQRRTSLNVTARRFSALKDELEFKQRNESKGKRVSWLDSSSVKSCKICQGKFNLTNRKHHCRSCGEVFCNKCSSYEIVIDGSLKRACLNCFKETICSDDIVNLGFRHTFNHKQSINGVNRLSNDSDINDRSIDTYNESQSYGKSFDGNGLTSESSVRLSQDSIPSWAEGIVYISKQSGGKTTQAIFPSDAFNSSFVNVITANAIPDLSGSALQEVNYVFRIREKDLATLNTSDKVVEDTESNSSSSSYNASTIWYYCYVSYRQTSTLVNNKVFVKGQALVVVSLWQYPQIIFKVLSIMDESYLWKSSENEKHIDKTISDMLMVSYSQIMSWPIPSRETALHLPFLGQILLYNMDKNLLTLMRTSVTLISSQWSVNLITLFGPLGLLQHIWIFWELIVTGQDIVVYSSLPSQCSEVVIALATILSPLNYLGDIRPYISAKDSDVDIIKNQSINQDANKNSSSFEARKRSKLIGTTDISLITQFSSFTAALFLTYPSKDTDKEVDQIFLGLRTKHTANFLLLGSKKDKLNDFTDCFIDWNAKNTGKCLLLSKVPIVSSMQKNLLRRIKHMEPRERRIIGEQLLRDNLKTMTVSYLQPANGSSIETEEIKLALEDKDRFKSDNRPRSKSISIENVGVLQLVDQLKDYLRSSPEFILSNIPSVILWLLYLLFLIIYITIGLPIVALIVVVFLVKLPDRASNELEELLSSFIPQHILYPLKKVEESNVIGSSSSTESVISSLVKSYPRLNMSGVWKRTKCINYETFLGAQGAGYVQRRLAANISMIHTITMNDHLSVFRLQEKGGPIDSDINYEINGDEIKSLLVKKEFLDKCYWDSDNALTLKKVHIPERDYELVVKRYLEESGKVIRLVATFYDLKVTTNKPVETTCYFEKTGDTPNPPPKSSRTVDLRTDTVGSNDDTSKENKIEDKVDNKVKIENNITVDYMGKRASTRTSAINKIDQNINNGLSLEDEDDDEDDDDMIALSKRMTRITKDLVDEPVTTIRPQLINNPSNTSVSFDLTGDWKREGSIYTGIGEIFVIHKLVMKDKTISIHELMANKTIVNQIYLIDGPEIKVEIQSKLYLERVYFEDNALVLHRKHSSKDFEVFHKRYLDQSGQIIQLVSKHKNLVTGAETESISLFYKTK